MSKAAIFDIHFKKWDLLSAPRNREREKIAEVREINPKLRLENNLLNNLEQGDLIPGMDGLRKVRVKSAAKGKSGGFRVGYLDFPEYGVTYYIVIYPKNVKEDLSPEEKKIILKMIKEIKREVKNG